MHLPSSATPIAELDRTRPVVIIKFDDNPLHHGTLGAIRSLGRAGVPVHVIHERRALPAGRSRYVRSENAWPATLSGPGDAVAVLSELASEVGGRPVLLPVDDAGAVFMSEQADALVDMYDFPRQPPNLARSLIDKHSLARICADKDIPHPRTIRPRSWDEFLAAEPPGGLWPVVVKRVAPWVPSVPGLPSTSIARSRDDLNRLPAHATTDEPGLLLQEYLPPSPKGDWFFHGYYDAAGTVRFSGTGVKRRSWPPYSGSTVLGQCVSDLQVLAQADALLYPAGYSGIVDVDLRFDPGTGRYHVLDVNPRMGAQHRLFQSAAGVDVVRALHLDLTGRALGTQIALDGRTFLAENLDPAAARRYIRDGVLDAATWWRSLRSVDEFAWVAGDDPVPFASMILRSAREGFRHRYPALHRRRDQRPPLASRIVHHEVGKPPCPDAPERSAR
jgi:predicted ATP-grasp superfamily ATP-dependent carboligase